MSKTDNIFPVLYSFKRDENEVGLPGFVKWDALSEDQAMKNHGQTLTRLAERGGLSPSEMTANVLGLGWCEIGGVTKDKIKETMSLIDVDFKHPDAELLEDEGAAGCHCEAIPDHG